MSKDQPRLGRGLKSLITSTIDPSNAVPMPRSAPPVAPSTLIEIELGLIDPNPMQPRRSFDPDRLHALADSLRNCGTLQPIVVRRRDGRFELVAGERRWRAAQIAGLPRIPAIIRTADDATMLELALVENLQREDLNAIERARAYLSLSSKFSMSHDEIGRRVGEDRSTVANYIRLLDLADEILELIVNRRLSMGHARCLLSVSAASQQVALARRIADEGWSVRQAEQHLHKLRQDKPQTSPTPPRAVISDLEERFSSALGLRVRIVESRRRNTGRVTIDYHGLDDFERLAARLGVKGE